MYLIPKPKELIWHMGECCLPYTGEIVAANLKSSQICGYAQLLKEEIETSVGFKYTIRQEFGDGPIFLQQNPAMGKQQYRLLVEEERICIIGGSAQGILYGIQTLRQILREKGACIPCLDISDFPDIETRGFYHDVTRGRVPKLSWLMTLADKLSFYKINQLQLYVEHSYLFSGLSELWRDDTPLTAEDIMALDKYCAARGIELVPSMSTFGHLYKLLSTKQYRALCELEEAGREPFGMISRMEHHTIDVCNPESSKLIKNMISEYMSLFSSDKFNICADETFDLGRGKNKEKAQKDGTAALYIPYVKDLCEFLVSRGKTPMLWGDVMLKFPELVKELPKETICLNWGYHPRQSEDSTRIYAETGVKQFVCPGAAGWNQFINLQRDSYDNIARMSSYGIKYGCIGLLNTDWGDFGHINHPAFSIPGMIYGAAASWDREKLEPYETLNEQISVLEYRDGSKKLLEIVGKLSEQESFGWRSAVYVKERWHQLDDESLKEKLFEEQKNFSDSEEKNRQIDEAVRALKHCMASMPENMRQLIYPYLIAADGMKIFNQIGAVILNKLQGKIDGHKNNALAKDLEIWYYHYRDLWRTVSRESELYRVSEVIFWYADYLRTLDRQNETKTAQK